MATPGVLDKAKSLGMLAGRHRHQVLRDLQKAGNVVWVYAPLLMRLVTQHDRRPISETDALKLSNLANNVTSIVRSVSSLVAVLRSVVNFCVAFEKEHGVSFLAARMVDIVDDMITSDFLTGDSRQTYYRYILVAKFLLQRPTHLNIIEDIDGEDTGFLTLGISPLDDETWYWSCTEVQPLQVLAASKYDRNPMKHYQLHASSL